MRRLVDVAISASALILLFPLLVAIAVAIVIDSPGNPFYRALRVGKDGRKFRMWKFRTMATPGNAWQTGPGITARGDSRITRLGGLLRRSKLDELPQFFNVLIGQMTLVGPRPEAPEFVAFYGTRQLNVLRVKPGVTGVVQIASAEESDSIPEGVRPDLYYVSNLMGPKLNMDLEYMETRTAWSDTRIVLATAAMVFRVIFKTLFRAQPEQDQAQDLEQNGDGGAMQVAAAEGASNDNLDRRSV